MRVSIAVRLFLMVSLSMAAVTLAGLGLVRWKLAGATPAGLTPPATQARVVDTLRAALASDYQANGSWGFLPAEADRRARWLGERALSVIPAKGDPDGLNGAWQALGPRLVLSDARGRVLAGEAPSRLLIMLASIDRVQRAVVVGGRTVGFVSVAIPHDARDALVIAVLIQHQHQLALLALIAAGLGALAAAIVATGFRRPINALVRGAHQLGAGRYGTRVDAHRSDELGELADTFNQLAARLERAETSRRQWVADTSHELRTPLAVLRAQIEALQDGVRPFTGESLELLATQTASLGRLVEDLHALAAADVGDRTYDRQRVELRELVVPVWLGFAERFAERQLTASMTGFDSAMILLADAQRLRQVIANLLENACRYTEAGGEVRLTGHDDGPALRILVDDSAPGVPAAMLDRLGERFFRVDPSRSRAAGGAGLGLALSREIVEAHGGRLTFSPSPLGGLRVTLTLPGAP